MFRSASARQSDLAEHRFAVHIDHWTRTADKWFDGTIASVDERIARLDNILLQARDTASRLGSTQAGRICGTALPHLEHSRRELAAVRDSLLKGFSDRQVDAQVSADRRTARAVDAPPPSVTEGNAPSVDITPETDRVLVTHGSRNARTRDQAGAEGYEKTWANGGYSGTVNDQLQAMSDEERKEVFRRHPWLASLQRAIVLGSRDFLAAQNTDDRDELLTRATRYAADETSTLPTPIARRVAAAFVGRVEELIAQRPRKRHASNQITHYADFDDQLIY